MSGKGKSTAQETIELIVEGGVTKLNLTGGQVVIKVCDGLTLPKLLRFGAVLSKELGLSLKDAEGVKDKLLSKVDDVSFILQLIADKADDVYDLLGSMSSLENKERVAALNIEDIFLLAKAVVEVNRDFFTKRVLPALVANAAKNGL